MSEVTRDRTDRPTHRHTGMVWRELDGINGVDGGAGAAYGEGIHHTTWAAMVVHSCLVCIVRAGPGSVET